NAVCEGGREWCLMPAHLFDWDGSLGLRVVTRYFVSNEPDDDYDGGERAPIEQLAADYRNAKDYADRKQGEADAAKAGAEAKLAELVAAGKALGLVLSVAGVELGSQIRCFRNEKLGLNPKYSDAVRLERCEVCGRRFGLHHGDDNSCPAEGDDDV
ncbi:MAG: hypothetical protein ACRCXB_29635, partial [Aeromonadaceae bacterium]